MPANLVKGFGVFHRRPVTDHTAECFRTVCNHGRDNDYLFKLNTTGARRHAEEEGALEKIREHAKTFANRTGRNVTIAIMATGQELETVSPDPEVVAKFERVREIRAKMVRAMTDLH